MEQYLLFVISVILSLDITGVSSLKCYQCHIVPPAGHYYNTTKRLCMHFDYSDNFVVDCPYSTMCMKQDIHLDMPDDVRIHATLRDCAPQKHEYQDYKNGKWSPKMEILEPYQEGCEDTDNKGERTTPTRFCYCRHDVCNSSPNTNHDGYTDIMGVILVFNLMKYINSLR